ncbi:hypothetical protein SAMN04487846_1655 [Microbacterium sp. cf046]|uniref:hypothetical protein n=1 Tax=Microbacterium sp. cf046 TaxID=1761803 RepID=UPI0008EF6C7E|nr:hypothetical protein [Microbacterium sp. cf046]SFS03282.1 hypothetical protein SAMN04487846_1655 [Microbacterium sp. cf046]
MTDDRLDENPEIGESVEETAPQERPQYGVGPFSVREVALVGVWLVAFVVSFFSIASEQAMSQLLFGGSVWSNGLDWILTIGAPTVAVFLIILRRFSPDGIRRVGSLGVDQFASVAFSVSAVVWLTVLWRDIAVAIQTGLWIYGWVVWVELVLMLAGVVLTVAAPFIPPFSEDFTGRREIVAHRNARPIRAVSPRPARPPREAAADADTDTAAFATGAYAQSDYAQPASTESGYTEQDAWAPAQTRDTFEPVDAETEPPSAAKAFWALTPEERDVVDERGVPIFRVGPTAWALVLEDRGEVFVVRNEDGRVGYLHDVSGVTRG